jgi:hypothetical protein
MEIGDEAPCNMGVPVVDSLSLCSSLGEAVTAVTNFLKDFKPGDLRTESFMDIHFTVGKNWTSRALWAEHSCCSLSCV